jgi:hypothetical protein
MSSSGGGRRYSQEEAGDDCRRVCPEWPEEDRWCVVVGDSWDLRNISGLEPLDLPLEDTSEKEPSDDMLLVCFSITFRC